MTKQRLYSEDALQQLLQQEPERAIDVLFRSHYAQLCRVVHRLISDQTIVEDLVQDVFYELWKKRSQLKIQSSFIAYLRRAARNKALNYIRDQKIIFEQEDQTPNLQETHISAIQELELAELQQQINQAIDQLPERCRIVFTLSRFEDMSYKEIANALNISTKTVENQISKALKLLRHWIQTAHQKT